MLTVFWLNLLDIRAPDLEKLKKEGPQHSFTEVLQVWKMVETLQIRAGWAVKLAIASYVTLFLAFTAVVNMTVPSWDLVTRITFWFVGIMISGILVAFDYAWVHSLRGQIVDRCHLLVARCAEDFLQEMKELAFVKDMAKIFAAKKDTFEAGMSHSDADALWRFLASSGKLLCLFCGLNGATWGVTAANAINVMMTLHAGLDDVIYRAVQWVNFRFVMNGMHRGLGYRRPMPLHVWKWIRGGLSVVLASGGIFALAYPLWGLSKVIGRKAVMDQEKKRKAKGGNSRGPAEFSWFGKTYTEGDLKTIRGVQCTWTVTDDGRAGCWTPVEKVETTSETLSEITPEPKQKLESGPTHRGRGTVTSGSGRKVHYWVYDDDFTADGYIVMKDNNGFTRIGENDRRAFMQWMRTHEDEDDEYLANEDDMAGDRYAEESGIAPPLSVDELKKIKPESDAWTRDTYDDAVKSFKERSKKKQRKAKKVTFQAADEPGAQESCLGRSPLDVSKLPVGVVHDKVSGAWQNAPVVGAKLLMNRHTLRAAKEDQEWVFRTGDGTEHALDMSKAHESEEHKDVVFLPIPKACQGMKSASVRMAVKLSKSDGASGALWGIHGLPTAGPVFAGGQLFGGKNPRHTCPTNAGSCGSYVVDVDGPSPAIVGFHAYGNDGTDTNGYYPLTDKMIKEIADLKLVSKK